MENLVGFYPNLQLDTSTSASQSFTSEDGVPNQRARVLGGGSAVNAGFFTFADPQFVAEMNWDVILVNESFTWVADEVAQIPTIQVFQVSSPNYKTKSRYIMKISVEQITMLALSFSFSMLCSHNSSVPERCKRRIA